MANLPVYQPSLSPGQILPTDDVKALPGKIPGGTASIGIACVVTNAALNAIPAYVIVTDNADGGTCNTLVGRGLAAGEVMNMDSPVKPACVHCGAPFAEHA
jgi:hypothetical protein